jgi:hypothetical protein
MTTEHLEAELERIKGNIRTGSGNPHLMRAEAANLARRIVKIREGEGF